MAVVNGVTHMTDGVFTVRQEFARTEISSPSAGKTIYETDLLETATLCMLENPGSIVEAIIDFKKIHPYMREWRVRRYLKAGHIYKRFI